MDPTKIISNVAFLFAIVAKFVNVIVFMIDLILVINIGFVIFLHKQEDFIYRIHGGYIRK